MNNYNDFNKFINSQFIIQAQSVLWIEYFGCQTNNHSWIYNFQMIFLSFTDTISPYLFLKYLLYNNTFTYLFSPLLFILFFFSFSLPTIFKLWKVSLSSKATIVVLDVYVFFDFPLSPSIWAERLHSKVGVFNYITISGVFIC